MSRQGERLPKEEIRLQYSGYILFATRLVSIFTGLAFQLMVARTALDVDPTKKLNDLWLNITDLLPYFTLLASVLPFWAMRSAAREEVGATKTGVIANLLISLAATAIYIPLVSLITTGLGINPKYVFLYYLVAVQITEYYAIGIAEACLRTRVPQAIGYGLLIAEFSKVILGYIFIVHFRLPIEGALISLAVAFLIQTIYYVKLLKTELQQKIRWHYVKEWLKGSLVNIYNIVGGQAAAYIFILLFKYGGNGGRSDYGYAFFIAQVITYSTFLAFALYPKLLVDRNTQDITTSLKMVLMFAIPMAAGAMAIPAALLSIIDVAYAEAAPVLVVLAVDAIINTLATFFNFVLYGAERVDEKAKMSFKELVKSRLFLSFSFPYFQLAVSVPTAYYILTVYAQNQPLNAAIYVSIINLACHFALFIVLYAVVRKMIKIEIPWKSIAKYVFTSAVMAIFIFMLPHPQRASLTIAITVLGGAVYIGLLLAIDRETRMLIRSVWQEIKIRISGAA
jgi:hypothetical protein